MCSSQSGQRRRDIFSSFGLGEYEPMVREPESLMKPRLTEDHEIAFLNLRVKLVLNKTFIRHFRWIRTLPSGLESPGLAPHGWVRL